MIANPKKKLRVDRQITQGGNDMYVQRLISLKDLNENDHSSNSKAGKLGLCTKSEKFLLLTQKNKNYHRSCSVCASLKVKINLHKARVKNSQLRLLYWLQTGANLDLSKRDCSKFKLNKQLDNNEFDKEV